jgi:hypothetical protein
MNMAKKIANSSLRNKRLLRALDLLEQIANDPRATIAERLAAISGISQILAGKPATMTVLRKVKDRESLATPPAQPKPTGKDLVPATPMSPDAALALIREQRKGT